MRLAIGFALSAAIGLGIASFSPGQEPGWTGRIIVPASEEAVRQATPIVERPYRPLHFYGNAVRRMHYHGHARPTMSDMRRGFQAWANRT